MKNRLRHVAWWRWVLATLSLAAVVYTGIAEDVVEAITVLAAITAAVFAVWNPFEARPKPTLTLRPVEGEEMTSISLGAALRPVDVDAVVENAKEAALAAVPSSSSLLALGQYAKPTQADYEKYEADVETYLEDVRGWAQDAEHWMRERAAVLAAEIMQRNPTSVDADDAGVFAFFPPGTEEFEDADSEPPEAPERPGFPLRKSPLTSMFQSTMGSDTFLRPSIVPDLDFSIARAEPISLWDPYYDRLPDGRLRVSYKRQPVRHGEAEPSGEPFRVRFPAGDHVVDWEVRAKNMPDAAKGTWKVSCQTDLSGNPITTVYDLEAALRGEPETEVDWDSIFARQQDGNGE